MANSSAGCGEILMHLLLVFLTCGLWLIVLIVMACVNASKK